MPYLSGTLPSCLFDISNTGLSEFWINDTNISGSVPSQICNNDNLSLLIISNNSHLTGSLPSCHNDDNIFEILEYIVIHNNPQLTGSIPPAYLCSYLLNGIQISNNPKMSGNTLPECWNDPNMTREFERINLENNAFSGSFPLIKAPYLEYLFIGHNDFEGTISDIISTIDSPYITGIGLQNNKFTESDISVFLADMMSLQSLKILALYGNDDIGGELQLNG